MQNKGFNFVTPNRFEKFLKSFPQPPHIQHHKKLTYPACPSPFWKVDINIRQNQHIKQANDNLKSKKKTLELTLMLTARERVQFLVKRAADGSLNN